MAPVCPRRTLRHSPVLPLHILKVQSVDAEIIFVLFFVHCNFVTASYVSAGYTSWCNVVLFFIVLRSHIIIDASTDAVANKPRLVLKQCYQFANLIDSIDSRCGFNVPRIFPVESCSTFKLPSKPPEMIRALSGLMSSDVILD